MLIDPEPVQFTGIITPHEELSPASAGLTYYSRDFNRWRMKVEDRNKETRDGILPCKLTGERQLAWLENSQSSRRPTDESVGWAL